MPGVTDPIRVPSVDELERLREVEVSAGRCFGDVGMPEIAADEPPEIAVLERYLVGGRLLVVGNPVLAYATWDRVDGAAHIEQVSVHGDGARRGLGRSLIDRVQVESGLALTLTTFRDVAWNAPYYERIGFRLLGADEVTPGLAAIRAAEAAAGLDRWARVCMRREVSRSH
ncbi:GNAT family N-acetyltransferase [Embleya sp. NBC_00896]|uniref:GNAT family N-acetyltransferase n=1 Tax=Embleya sp. NBC_00896 TaxID=2975961 RepID=UPI00386DE8B5|nr:GNAT family N-acetyltransferase [Embleya sp. NBC_00896]